MVAGVEGRSSDGLQRLAWRDGDADGGRLTRPPLSRPDPGVMSHGHGQGQAQALARGLPSPFAPVRRTERATRTGPRSMHAAGARRVPAACMARLAGVDQRGHRRR